MTATPEQRLAEAGLTLPDAAAPVANYVPAVIADGMLWISGQVTIEDGRLVHIGKLGREIGLEEGQMAARLCALNVIAQAKRALGGDLGRVRQVVKLTVFVNAADDFTQHPEVANGASDLMVLAFGDAGRHARAAVGAGSLPRGVAVEVEAVFAVR